MQVGIRTPAEVIALAIEDAGIPVEQARSISEDAAKRLARCLIRLTDKSATSILWGDKGDMLSWGHVDHAKEAAE